MAGSYVLVSCDKCGAKLTVAETWDPDIDGCYECGKKVNLPGVPDARREHSPVRPKQHFATSDDKQHNAPINPTAPTGNYRWVACQDCDGEIGIPADLTEGVVTCPECSATIKLHGTILYRKKKSPNTTATPTTQKAKVPSATLETSAERTLACGIASIVLGWTVIVPAVGGLFFLGSINQSASEKVAVPTKAWIGFGLIATFGFFQTITVLAHAFK